MKDTDTIFYITANKGFTQQPTLNVMIQQLEGEGYKWENKTFYKHSNFDHIQVDLRDRVFNTYNFESMLHTEYSIFNVATDWESIDKLIEIIKNQKYPQIKLIKNSTWVKASPLKDAWIFEGYLEGTNKKTAYLSYDKNYNTASIKDLKIMDAGEVYEFLLQQANLKGYTIKTGSSYTASTDTLTIDNNLVYTKGTWETVDEVLNVYFDNLILLPKIHLSFKSSLMHEPIKDVAKFNLFIKNQINEYLKQQNNNV